MFNPQLSCGPVSCSSYSDRKFILYTILMKWIKQGQEWTAEKAVFRKFYQLCFQKENISDDHKVVFCIINSVVFSIASITNHNAYGFRGRGCHGRSPFDFVANILQISIQLVNIVSRPGRTSRIDHTRNPSLRLHDL